jgi:hypothetical protein
MMFFLEREREGERERKERRKCAIIVSFLYSQVQFKVMSKANTYGLPSG